MSRYLSLRVNAETLFPSHTRPKLEGIRNYSHNGRVTVTYFWYYENFMWHFFYSFSRLLDFGSSLSPECLATKDVRYIYRRNKYRGRRSRTSGVNTAAFSISGQHDSKILSPLTLAVSPWFMKGDSGRCNVIQLPLFRNVHSTFEILEF